MKNSVKNRNIMKNRIPSLDEFINEGSINSSQALIINADKVRKEVSKLISEYPDVKIHFAPNQRFTHTDKLYGSYTLSASGNDVSDKRWEELQSKIEAISKQAE